MAIEYQQNLLRSYLLYSNTYCHSSLNTTFACIHDITTNLDWIDTSPALAQHTTPLVTHHPHAACSALPIDNGRRTAVGPVSGGSTQRDLLTQIWPMPAPGVRANVKWTGTCRRSMKGFEGAASRGERGGEARGVGLTSVSWRKFSRYFWLHDILWWS